MIVRYLFFHIFLITFIYSSYQKDIDKAINQLYNFEIDQSIQTLEKLSLEYPEDPLIPFLRISVYWQQSLLNDNPKSSYEIMVKNNENDDIVFASVNAQNISQKYITTINHTNISQKFIS